MSDAELTPIVVGGFRGCYREVGAGPPLVLLVTTFGRAAMYGPTIRALSRTFRVIAVESPGCGCGQRLQPTWDFDDYARWTIALLDALDLRDVILVGHSHSGAVALLAAARDDRRIRCVVLADTVGAEGTQSVWGVLAACAACIPMELSFVLHGLPYLFGNLARHARNFVMAIWRAVRVDVRGAARRVRVPALIAWGAHDYVMPLSDALRFAAILPLSSVYVSKRGSHDWLIEHAEEFAGAVRAFVATTPARTASARQAPGAASRSSDGDAPPARSHVSSASTPPGLPGEAMSTAPGSA